jgi:alpha-glucosidase
MAQAVEETQMLNQPFCRQPSEPLRLWLVSILVLVAQAAMPAADSQISEASPPQIRTLNPPGKGFFSKQVNFVGIPIKAHAVVADAALLAAYGRLNLLLTNLVHHQPLLLSNLVAAGVELHIIGRDQVTTDLPEWRQDKGKPLAEYQGLTRDQRTRGMGGRLTSCGEENLLKIQEDRYFGRDICLHEFAHSIRNYGMSRDARALFDAQYHRSLDRALWKQSYAGSNPDEFFAELTMWYFGTHGDLHMTGPKPENGPEGLKKYDSEAFDLMDNFYRGRIAITKATHAARDE